MNQVNQEDWLDRELRQAAPYIDDDGFTARVLQQLPPPRRGHDLLRAAILLGMTFLASVLAYVVSGGGRFVSIASGLVVAAAGAMAAISRGQALQA
jgi:hypothetical protein